MFRRLFATSIAASLTFVAIASQPVHSESPVDSEEMATESVVNQPINLEKNQIHEVLGLSFEAPEGFSPVQGLERKTAGIVYPANKKFSPRMIVRLAEMESSGDNWVKLSDQEQMMYAKYLFLGSNAPTREEIQRDFFGTPVKGEIQTVRTRDGYRYLELYILTLEKTDRKVAIAFESDTRLPLVQVETTMDTVANSLKELDVKTKKRKKKKQTQSLTQR